MKKMCAFLAAAISLGALGAVSVQAADAGQNTAPVSITEMGGQQKTVFIMTYHEIDGEEVPVPYGIGVEPRMKYISDISAWIGLNGHMVTCTGSMTTKREYEKTLSLSLEKNESNWKRLKTWTTTDYENSMVVSEHRYSLAYRDSYRAVTTASVITPDGGSEVVSGYSATIYY